MKKSKGNRQKNIDLPNYKISVDFIPELSNIEVTPRNLSPIRRKAKSSKFRDIKTKGPI